MQELIAQFKEQADEHLKIMWYDSMTSDGKMDWQNALTDKNKAYLVDAEMNPLADSMFLNFWWTTDKLADKELLKASNEKPVKSASILTIFLLGSMCKKMAIQRLYAGICLRMKKAFLIPHWACMCLAGPILLLVRRMISKAKRMLLGQ